MYRQLIVPTHGKLSSQYSEDSVIFCKVDADVAWDVITPNGVKAFPTFKVFPLKIPTSAACLCLLGSIVWLYDVAASAFARLYYSQAYCCAPFCRGR